MWTEDSEGELISVYSGFNEMDEAREAKTRLHYPGCVIHVLGASHHVIQWVDAENVNQLMDEFMIDRPGKKY